MGDNSLDENMNYIDSVLSGMGNLSDEEILREIARDLSNYTYYGTKKETIEGQNKLLEALNNKLEKPRSLKSLGISLHVRIAVSAVLKKDFEKALQASEKAKEYEVELTDDEKNEEKTIQGRIRLRNIYSDVLLRRKNGDDVKLVQEFLEQGRDLLEKFDPKSDPEKEKWKKRNLGWNRRHYAEFLFQLNQKDNEEKIKGIFDEALGLFAEGGNPSPLKDCIQKVKELGIQYTESENIKNCLAKYDENHHQASPGYRKKLDDSSQVIDRIKTQTESHMPHFPSVMGEQ